MRSTEQFIPTTFEQRLQRDPRNKLILSDFDETLCHRYTFDRTTNNHHAVIDPELARVAGNLPLIIATATRAMHPKITQILESGMVSANGLLIAENGGVILNRDGSTWWSVEENQEDVKAVQQQIIHELPRTFTTPDTMQLIAKQGLTSIIVRAQHESGQHDPAVQSELQEALQEMAGEEWTVVDGGRSLTIQRPGISKINALAHTGLDRNRFQLICLGDGDNDIDSLTAADIGIAVGERIASHADFVVDPDVRQVTTVLKTIGRAATSFKGWHKYDPQEEARRSKDRVWY